MIDSRFPDYNSDREWLRSSPIASVFTQLKNGIWHTTSPRGYLGIRRSGCINPNTGQYQQTSPATANSYGLMKGYVCLFDFETASEAECESQFLKWDSFFSRQPFSIAIELERTTISARLVPYEVGFKEVGYKKIMIPYVEAWHTEPITLSAVKSYLLLPADNSKNPFWLSPDNSSHAELEAIITNESDLITAQIDYLWT